MEAHPGQLLLCKSLPASSSVSAHAPPRRTQCVTSGIKGPVAVLDAATLSAPPRLKIYDTLIEKETARSQDNHKGIPTVLLDYLVVTAFLLVTDVQEWLDRPRDARIPGSSSYTIQRWLAIIHHRPAPPEPEHPTVDLSLTVPSTPPHSATIPSPGGLWETRSGVTSFSGSNGSSGASYLGEPFTPTTPATPFTPATSTNSFASRSVEDVPPVPPVPGSSSGSPFAYNVEYLTHERHERHRSTPQTLLHSPHSHSPHSSTSTAQGPSAMTQAEGENDSVPPLRTRPTQTLSLPANVHPPPPVTTTASFSTSEPASPYTGTSSADPSRAPSSRRRQLPIPPGPVPANSFAQPWLYSSLPTSSTPVTTPPAPPSIALPSTPPAIMPSTPTTPVSVSTSARARASMRGSLRTSPIPPPPPPPQHSIPLPPKLAQEQQGYATRIGPRPRTAPELEHANRRRHSAGEFGEYNGQECASSSVHPYAAASQTYSVSGRDVGEMVGQMQGLRVSTQPGPSNIGGHVRAPSQPAPDYDTHSFVNMPPPVPPLPPLPTPPGSSDMSGLRSPVQPGRRVLTVVNGDPASMPIEDPGRRPRERMRAHAPAPRISYAESVYEAPPPAYDAIDFSVPAALAPARSTLPRIPPMQTLPPLPQVQQMPITPLPAPPVEAGGEGHRGS